MLDPLYVVAQQSLSSSWRTVPSTIAGASSAVSQWIILGANCWTTSLVGTTFVFLSHDRLGLRLGGTHSSPARRLKAAWFQATQSRKITYFARALLDLGANHEKISLRSSVLFWMRATSTTTRPKKSSATSTPLCMRPHIVRAMPSSCASTFRAYRFRSWRRIRDAVGAWLGLAAGAPVA
jgi:hypothetical protein